MTIRKVERAAPPITKLLDAEVLKAQNEVHLATAKRYIYMHIESLFDNRELPYSPAYFFKGPNISKDSGTFTFKSKAALEDLAKVCSRLEKHVLLKKPLGAKGQAGQVSPSVTAVFSLLGDTISVSDFKVTSY